MTTRLNTPGLIIAAVASLAVGMIGAWQVFQGSANDATLSPISVPSAGSSAASGRLDTEALYAKRAQSVVTIQAMFGDGSPVQGSAFAYNRDGVIVTNWHNVVDRDTGRAATEILVRNGSTHEEAVAEVVGYDRLHDIAVLRVTAGSMQVQPAPMGESTAVLPGQEVASIGTPVSLENSITKGIVSATHRTRPAKVHNGNITNMIQVDAPINVGNSGGPIFNRVGEVIGMTQQIGLHPDHADTFEYSTGMAFAIPADTIENSVEQILTNGSARYATIGIQVRDFTAGLAAAAQLPVRRGVIVQKVTGPAAAAGLSAGNRAVSYFGPVLLGDVITQIGDARIQSVDDIEDLELQLKPGRAVTVTYFRGTERKTTLVEPSLLVVS